MADKYVVTAAASYVFRTDGTAAFLLAGAPVPEDATEDCLLDLLGKDMIAKMPASFEAGGIPNDIPDVPVVPASKAQAKPGGKPAGV